MEQVVVWASSSCESDRGGESYNFCRRLHCICDCQVIDEVLLSVVGTYNISSNRDRRALSKVKTDGYQATNPEHFYKHFMLEFIWNLPAHHGSTNANCPNGHTHP
jgi:hypothetical protein